MKPAGTLLIVDDEDLLRFSLARFLADLGFKVLEAGDGQEALAIAGRERPDLVLLDLDLPVMDGFQVCARLRGDPATAGIPVLVITALLETSDKMRAFAAGAVDYVVKPFHFQEVQARVQTQLELHRQRRELLTQFEALRRLEALRDSFTHMVAHDMRGPLSGITAALELALADLPPGFPALAKKLELAQAGAGHLSAMITQMLELSRMEAGRMPLKPSACDLAALARSAVEARRADGGGRRVALDLPPEPVSARCDPDLVERVLDNLLSNALKFTRPAGHVTVTVRPQGRWVRVEVGDDGPGIAPEHRAQVFDKFHQTPAGVRAHGVGLGLAFCKSAVLAHHGEIGVDNPDGGGCRFWFTLPA
jgi:signal transduction histidine kinase